MEICTFVDWLGVIIIVVSLLSCLVCWVDGVIDRRRSRKRSYSGIDYSTSSKIINEVYGDICTQLREAEIMSMKEFRDGFKVVKK